MIESIFFQVHKKAKYEEFEDEEFVEATIADAILASLIDQTYLKQKNNSEFKDQIALWAGQLYGSSTKQNPNSTDVQISSLARFYSFVYTFDFKLEIIAVDFHRTTKKDLKQN